MTRFPITKHGRDHRLPGTNGPDDTGGHDPIPGLVLDPSVPTIHVEELFTSTLANGSPLNVSFDADAGIVTNDGGYSLTGSGPTSPFDGTYYSLNWSGNAHRINIDAAGVYYATRFWNIDALGSGTFSSPGQNFFQMEFENAFTGTVIFPSGGQSISVGASNIIGVVLSGAGFNGVRVCSDSAWIVSDGSASYPQELHITHTGIEGDATIWSAGITISRLGDV